MMNEHDDNLELISTRTRSVAISAIKEMSILSARVDGAASLAWGLPSFKTPEPIRRAVAHALENDPQIGMYALPGGLSELREAVVAEHQHKTGVSVNADKNVMITAGNMEGLNTLFHVIINPGDEVIVTDPGFVSHLTQIRFNGGKPIYWQMDEAKGWQLDVDDLPGLISSRTKAIVLVSPSNPTGSILSEEALRAVAKIAKQHGLLVILDDPYSLFTYENQNRFFNLASAAEYSDNIVYLFTFSKAFAMSGWRVGYMVVPAVLRNEIVKIHDLTMICTPRISQVAALAALETEPRHLKEFQNSLGRRRSLICERLDRIPHVFQYVQPEGAYYVFPRIVVEHESAIGFAHDLLDQVKVTVTPGCAFGPSGEHHIRMAYCVEDDTINLAFDRLESHFGT